MVRKKKPIKKKQWFTQKISEIMNRRRMAKSQSALYQQFKQQIQFMQKNTKEDWMEDQCNEIEDWERKHAYRTQHQKIKTVPNVKKKNTTGLGVVDKKEKMLYVMEDLKMRWEEYIQELFEDNRCRVLSEICGKVDDCEITIDEMENAIIKMSVGKATGQDKIAVEMLSVR